MYVKLYVKLIVLYIVIFGGRGRVRTGRRGKTVKFALCVIYIVILLEEGAV